MLSLQMTKKREREREGPEIGGGGRGFVDRQMERQVTFCEREAVSPFRPVSLEAGQLSLLTSSPGIQHSASETEEMC